MENDDHFTGNLKAAAGVFVALVAMFFVLDYFRPTPSVGREMIVAGGVFIAGMIALLFFGVSEWIDSD